MTDDFLTVNCLLSTVNLIIIKRPCTVDAQVLEHGSLRTDGDIEEPVLTNGRNTDRHLPAVHFAGDGQRKRLQLQQVQVVVPIGREIPFWGQAETSIEGKVGAEIRFESGIIRLQVITEIQ